jgi:hypothetical protein
MTNQQINPQPQRRQYREDYKAQKLIQRIEAKLKAQENRAQTSSSKN